ncbi:class I SAM-dependent methyltransferase [Kitasatospora sp. NPDC051914]|uniref:O-methyltransferase n=1 Tax=Kitasatospora sp. NPDC051914 TaxID=3154945 RepID=UPI003446801C
MAVVCGDSAEHLVVALALLALRATAHPVPLTASPESAASTVRRAHVIVADASGRARLDAWGAERVLPAELPVVAVDLAAGAAAVRPCRLPPRAGEPVPDVCGGGARLDGPLVRSTLEALRGEVPEAALARCVIAAPMSVTERQTAFLAMVLELGGRFVLPPPGPVLPARTVAGTDSGVPGWLRAARPTALAVTSWLAAELSRAAASTVRRALPLPALFGTERPPLLWCGEPVDPEAVRKLAELGIPVYATGVPGLTSPGVRRAGTAHPAERERGGPPSVRAAGRPTAAGRTGLDDPAVRSALASLRSSGSVATASSEFGWLLYSLVRSLRPTNVLECGGSYGSALLHLAAGLRDNSSGRLVGSAPSPYWAARVRRALTEAGLAGWAEVCDRSTCGVPDELAGAVDIAVLSGWREDMLPALAALEPRMRPGTVVVAAGPPSPEYLARVRRSGDYTSTSLAIGGGVEVSHRLSAGPAPPRVQLPAEPDPIPSLPPSGEHS